ncbi:chromosome segregation protein SMC [Arthrobacter sp. KK5.5]|uniref:chromosome segregation protein SMC n=1 Tax=Arthrobacter sp. KK5.5 TaxID=3373084 RepID=UPI003EE80278
MHLKSLTVRGFKSFASATTFDFEPGVTAVVGPNGSGKSNVVDALAWVMGEQGAKTLRGGKMDDVIFAGTSGRPPLGRAQVSLTIDNADGALPIEYAEVTITRTLFRTGGSEYAVNGSACRLLDIQELLSDSGLGREMHVIVGQGQLDRILHATADDRRGFIEEAAGILKHRRRKEKTVRKLEAMQGNLNRLQDLTAEVRRQLTPLGRQAEVARRAQAVQFEVRDARARLLADDLASLNDALDRDLAEEEALKTRQTEVAGRLDAARGDLAELELAAGRATPSVNAARDNWYRIDAARERLNSLGALASERVRLLGSAEPQSPDPVRDPDRLRDQAGRLEDELASLNGETAARRADLESAVAGRAAAEESAMAEERRLTALLRAAADRREGLARLAGLVGATRSRVESAEGELGRLRAAREAVAARHRAAEEEFTVLEQRAAGVEEGEEGLDTEFEEAEKELRELESLLDDLRARGQGAEVERGGLSARLEALRSGLSRRDATEDVLRSEPRGIGGRISAELVVAPGYETAVAAALGQHAEALTAEHLEAAGAVLGSLRDDDGGRVHLLFADAPAPAPHGTRPTAPARPLLEFVTCDSRMANAVARLLGRTAVVDDAAAAPGVVIADPEWTVVTRGGDVFSAAGAAGGSGRGTSLIEQQAAVEDTEARLAEAVAEVERLRFEAAELDGRATAARSRRDAALARLHESDARISAVAERLGELGSVLRQTDGERARLADQADAAASEIARGQEELAAAIERFEAARQSPGEEEPATGERDALAAAATAARQGELEARLALRATEDQASGLRGRIESLRRAADTERRARREAERRAEVRRVQAARAGAVGAGVVRALAHVAVSLEAAAAEREAAEEIRSGIEVRLAAARSETEALAAEFARMKDVVHRDELARAQQRSRIESLENRSIEELGLSPDHLLANYGPNRLVPAPVGGADKWASLRQRVDDDGEDLPEAETGTPFVRAEQEKRLKRAERDLASLGKVNPLALEEFAALEDRHGFLATQLEDLKSSRKDLLDIIKDVDERVQQVFGEAFADTAAQFERVFGRLFPGGEGRLVLTDPEDMLGTGIEVEARPAGKKIKRLSLLSGGERSLTAVALLVAIFKARPSPFYVMDEVEAALDDTNLGRLITVFEELRETSQLIVITHQKRTMEVADALYGVTMRGDGVSTVISQRLERRDVVPRPVKTGDGRRGSPAAGS